MMFNVLLTYSSSLACAGSMSDLEMDKFVIYIYNQSSKRYYMSNGQQTGT